MMSVYLPVICYWNHRVPGEIDPLRQNARNFQTHLLPQVWRWFAPVQLRALYHCKEVFTSLHRAPPPTPGVKVTWWMMGQSDQLSNAARHCRPWDSTGGRNVSQWGQRDIRIKAKLIPESEAQIKTHLITYFKDVSFKKMLQDELIWIIIFTGIHKNWDWEEGRVCVMGLAGCHGSAEPSLSTWWMLCNQWR